MGARSRETKPDEVQVELLLYRPTMATMKSDDGRRTVTEQIWKKYENSIRICSRHMSTFKQLIFILPSSESLLVLMSEVRNAAFQVKDGKVSDINTELVKPYRLEFSCRQVQYFTKIITNGWKETEAVLLHKKGGGGLKKI